MLLHKTSFATSYSKAFLWTNTMFIFFKEQLHLTEAVIRKCFVKKVLLKILQNSQGNICAGVPLFLETWLKIYYSTGVFLWILRKFQGHLSLEHLERLLLTVNFFLEVFRKFNFKRTLRTTINKCFRCILSRNKYFWYIFFIPWF